MSAVGYLDDVTAHGNDWRAVWQDTLRVLRVLTQAGFMVNLRKCKFLRGRVTVLGTSFFDYSYRLGDKTLKKWVSMQLPRNLKQLQSVVGKLVWASSFIPGFKALVQPIEGLLSRKPGQLWDQRCTDALNELARLVFQRLQLGLADWSQPFQLHVEESRGVVQAVLTQQREGTTRPVSIICRRCTPAEGKMCDAER